HLPQLTKPQAAVLALWSFGMVLARSCSLTAVSLLLAATLGLKEGSVRQRLREFTYEAAAKRGEKRRELEVEACFGPLLAWVVALADRGLYARWLFRRIVRRGWRPFLRVNGGGTFRPEGAGAYRPLAAFAPRVGSRWAGRGVAFQGKERRLACTLLACWGEGY